MIRTRLYRDGNLEASDFDPALVSDYLEELGTVVWMDLTAPSAGDLDMLAEEFRLHPLALEDALHPHQRPKVERYEHHVFLVVYSARLEGAGLAISEVDAFVGDRFLITVRKDPAWPIEPLLERWDQAGWLTEQGVGYLLYGLLDTVVDDYFPVSEAFGDRVEKIEDDVLGLEERSKVQQELVDLRRDLVGFRRIVLPMQEVLNALSRRDLTLFSDEIAPYFRDVGDHLMRVGDAVGAMEDVLSGAFSLHLSAASNRLNDIMRRVTGWAAIIGVATTIAGIYGMNFRLFPRGESSYGFWIANGLILVSATALYVYFRRREWL